MKSIRTKSGLAAIVIAGLLQTSPALAAGPPAEAGNNFLGGRIEVSFIKWVTDANAGTMAGVVSGDVGAGAFVGQIVEYNPGDPISTIVADYHINGGTYSFTARNNVTQDNVKGTAVIDGTVTSAGPLNGARVQGEYQVIPNCVISDSAPGGNYCFQGTLVVRPGLGRK